ncbi:MAG: hypothetical protein IPL41_16580 [Micropruina sp.]|nr:hypothetical protein [Micropruina sp.]
MANWTDGPEYAPVERPAAFETPAAQPLAVPPVAPNPAAGAPLAQPDWQPPQTPGVPLEALAPQAGLTARDPRAAFTTVSSLATANSAWQSAHSTTGTLTQPAWTPTQPLTTSAPVSAPTGFSGSTGPVPAPSASAAWPAPTGAPAVAGTPPRGLSFPPPQQPPSTFPQPGTPDWFAPPTQGRWRPPDQSVTVGQMWRAATPGVMIPLIIGALINPLSLVLLGAAALLASRVRYRLPQVRRVFAWGFGFLAAVGVLSLYNSDFELETTWSVLSGWAQVLCWIMPIVVLLQVGAGIRAHEPPSRP